MLQTILFRLGHLGLLIGLCGASIVYSFNVLSGHATDLAGPAFAFLTVFVVYNFDHLRDSGKADLASTPLRARYMLKYARLFRFLIGGCLIAYVLLAWRHRPYFLSIGAFYVLSGLFYVLPLLPGRRVKRLKDIPFFKNFYVPFCWLILVLYSRAGLARPEADVLTAFGYFALRLFVSVTTGDIRDLKGDREAGMLTVAILVGRGKALLLLQSVNLSSIGLIVFACLRGIWPWHALFMIIPVLYIAALLRVLELDPSKGEFVSEIFDFELIAYGPILLLAETLR